MSDDLDLVGRVRLDTSGLHEGVSAISSSLGKIGALAAGAFAVDKLVSWGKAGIGVAADMQQTSISFETMLGSGQKAQAFLKDLRAFAAATPFEFPELATAASSLISVGIETSKVIPIMTTLGNVTSGMGTGSDGVKRATVALQQMNAAGRITGEDLNQLRDAGIPVYDLLAGAIGKSKEEVAKLAQNGKLGKKELDLMMGALESGKGLERFNGLMQKQSQTLNGVISTLKDTLSGIAIDFITPYLPAMTNALNGFATFVQKSVVPFLHEFVNDLGLVFDAFKALNGGDAEGFDNALNKLFGSATGVKNVFKDIGDVAYSVIGYFKDLALGFQGVGAGLGPAKDLDGVFYDLGVILKDVAGFIVDHWQPILIGLGVALALAVAPVTTFVAAFIYAYTHFQIFNDIVNWCITNVTAAIAHLVAFGQEMWPQFQEAATHVFHAIQDVVSVFVVVVKKLWEVFGDDILAYAKAAWGMIQGVIEGQIKVIQNVIRLVLAVINGDWGKAWDALKGIVGGVFDQIQAIVKGAGGMFMAIIRGWGDGISAAASAAFDGIKAAFKAAINWVIDHWNSLSFTTPKVHIPGTDSDVGGDKFSVPQIPRLKLGGTALTDGFAIVGDGGNGSGTELAYLRKGATIDPRLPEFAAANGGSSSAANVSVELHFHGPTDGDSVRGAIPDLIDALKAGVGQQ